MGNNVFTEEQLQEMLKNDQIYLDNEPDNDEDDMSFMDHLSEMRHRLTIIAVSFVVLFLLFYLNSNTLLNFVLNIARGLDYNLTYIKPQEIFVERIRLSFISALIVNIPMLMWHICAFVSPAFDEEKVANFKMILFCLITLALFVCGMFFSYKILMPAVFGVLHTIGDQSSVTGMVTVESFVSLAVTITLAIGFAFELPIATAILTFLGAITPELMKKGFSISVVLMFIISAIITPPDVISQCIVAVPLICLYVISIMVSLFVSKIHKIPTIEIEEE